MRTMTGPRSLLSIVAAVASALVLAPNGAAAQAGSPTVAPPVATIAAPSAFNQLRWRMVGPARGGNNTTKEPLLKTYRDDLDLIARWQMQLGVRYIFGN